MAGEDKARLHVAMFPWLAFGHIIPFLELSKYIAQKGHRVSFISTPRNIDRLPKIPPELDSSITLIKVPLPRIPELPDNAEATMDIRSEDMPHLKKAFDGLEDGIARFLEDAKPDWIIYDFAPHWLPPIASRLGVSRAFFFIINAWFLAFFGPSETLISGSDPRSEPEDFMVPPEWVKFETSVAFRRFEAKWIVGAAQEKGSGFSDFYRGGKCIVGCEALVLRHCLEFEPEWLRVLEELYRRPVIPLGLMPPKVIDYDTSDSTDENNESWVAIKAWLDGQSEGTVVYVALGSEVTPSRDQLRELAHGLELSGIPFFWVLRKPSGSYIESNSMELPEGFEERTRGRGIVWQSWAPQLNILSHKSVGGFLTHCGWSSIVEGLMCGLPLVTLPFLVDQGLNSRVVVQKQLGVEVPRNEDDGSYTRNSVAESVKLIMHESGGLRLREKAKEASAMFGDVELHNQYLDNFVGFLESHRGMPSH